MHKFFPTQLRDPSVSTFFTQKVDCYTVTLTDFPGYLCLELCLGDPGVQLLPRPGAGVRRGLLEEGEVRAQPPHVLVDLEQHLHQSQLGTPRSRDTQ